MLSEKSAPFGSATVIMKKLGSRGTTRINKLVKFRYFI
jgi:hypothetical protein